MWSLRGALYSSLPQTDKEDAVESQATVVLRRHAFRWPKSTIILLITNIVTLAALFYTGRSIISKAQLQKACANQLSTPSPALAAVKYKAPAHYDAEFRQTNKWRGPPGEPTDEVDIAWHEIELGAGGVRLTEEEVRVLNITGTAELPLHKIPDEHGGGYLGMLEVFHLMHCLNSLRMGLWFNYPRYKWLDDDVKLENTITHHNHCLDMLRISLMCSADVTPALFYDPLHDPRRRDALPNWSSMHTCRDFDAILDWNKNGPRAVRWRDAGANPAWDPKIEGADPPFSPEDGVEEEHHHH